ncbi:MAG: 3beta-hydroxy-delta5-steroid dehydrogenase/steroid delta-isomerase [Halieaceae bacterium]|jgi:3beta-hydroxy-delta5-steroid dehydrogenase/steroid delta-isomerase
MEPLAGANTVSSDQPLGLGFCLVTGAAGFVGSALVRALLARGLTVRALIRNTKLDIEHPALEYFGGDVQNIEEMVEACRDIDTAFHTAAFLAVLGGSAVSTAYRDRAFAINVGGADNLVKACKVNGVKRLIHTSSVDVCFNSEVDMHMDEHTPYATRFNCVYTETKIDAEKIVLDANNPYGLLTCSLRPDGIWGPVGNIMLDTLLEQLIAGRMVARIGGQGGHHDHVHVDNLVHAHLLAADALSADGPLGGKAYFISDGEPAAMFDFLKPFFEGLRYQVPKPNIPAAPLRLIMRLWQWLHFKFGISEPLFTPHELNKLVISNVVSSDAAKRDFGYQPIKSVSQGMAESVESYRLKLSKTGSTE